MAVKPNKVFREHRRYRTAAITPLGFLESEYHFYKFVFRKVNQNNYFKIKTSMKGIDA